MNGNIGRCGAHNRDRIGLRKDRARGNRPFVFGSILGASWLLVAGWAGAASPGEPFTASATTGPGTLQFSVTNYSVTETVRSVKLEVKRSQGSSGTVTVDFATANGTAEADQDYQGTNGTLSFGPGVTKIQLQIAIRNDALDEPDEIFSVTLSNPTGGATLGAQQTANVSIRDNDIGGILSFGAETYSVSETNPVALILVKRSGGAAGGVTVDFFATNGVATPGVDFVPTNGTLVFGSNEMAKIFPIVILPDQDPEGDETVNLYLGNPTGGAQVAAPGEAALRILDDEVSVAFSQAEFVAAEGTPMAQVTVARSGPLTASASVDYATAAGGSATEGEDYVATRGTILFAPGVASGKFMVRLINDTLVEPAETVALQLSNPQNALLGTLHEAVLKIDNDDLGGEIQLSAANYNVSEKRPVAYVLLKRTGGIASGVSVDLSTADQDATAGEDYVALQTNLTFAAKETKKMVAIPLFNDSLDESNEVFQVVLGNPQGGATIGPRSRTTVTILDDDVAGMLQFGATSFSVKETEATAAIVVKRTGGRAGNLTVRLFSQDGTAHAGEDYDAVDQTLTFAEGESSKTVPVAIRSDSLPEGNESIQLALADPTGGAKLGSLSNAVLTIIDDEHSVVGRYKVTGTVTLSGCSMPDDNGRVSFSGEVYLPSQTGTNFEGRGVFLGASGGRAAVLILVGNVDESGFIRGNYSGEGGAGTFTGSVVNERLQLSIDGHADPDSCRQTGSMSGPRYEPPPGGFAPDYMDGRVLGLTIANGSAPLQTSGLGQVEFSSDGEEFRAFVMPAHVLLNHGPFQYTKNNGNTATLVLSDLDLELNTRMTLHFTSATAGTYSAVVIGGPGSQSGSFSLEAGNGL